MKTQLVAAFEESLGHLPDAEAVLTGMRLGIRRRRRRVRVATAAGAALILVATAVTVVSPRDRPAPPAAASRAGEWRSTLAAGWLPPGLTLAEISTGRTADGFVYRGSGATLTATVTKRDTTPRLDADGWQAREIYGRPGRERFEPGRILVGRSLPSGHWAEVTFAATRTDPELRADAELVAGSLREDAEIPVRVDVAPTYLPDGFHVTGLSADPSTPGRGTVICTDYTETRLTLSLTLMNLLAAERIADIQGRPAYLTDNRKTLVVNIYHGAMLVVSGAPLDELIKIAEGARWLG
jgi:hypothetical protein